jgi:hypothetical protein
METVWVYVYFKINHRSLKVANIKRFAVQSIQEVVF